MTLAPAPCLSPFLETFPTLLLLALSSSLFHFPGAPLVGLGAWAWEDRGVLDGYPAGGKDEPIVENGFSWKSVASSLTGAPQPQEGLVALQANLL